MSSTLDPFRATDKLDPDTLDVLVARLEARGHHPRFVSLLSEYLDRMDIDGKRTVLDLGSGTGVAARAIARRPRFMGTVLGIDLSNHLVQAANRLAVDEKLDARVCFRTGDTHALQLASGSFDAAVAHTLFSHLDEPAKVLAETRRILRPGGIVGIFDGDYASMTFELPDDNRSRRMDDVITRSLVTNPRILRQLPRLLPQAGFMVDTVIPSIITEVRVADFWKASIQAYAKLVPRAGILGESETAAWLDDLMSASARGEFFGSCVYYAYIARAV